MNEKKWYTLIVYSEIKKLTLQECGVPFSIICYENTFITFENLTSNDEKSKIKKSDIWNFPKEFPQTLRFSMA